MKQFTKLLPIEHVLVPLAPQRRFAGCNKRCYEGAAILSVSILNSAQAGGLETGVRFPYWVLPRNRGLHRRQQQCQHLSYSRSLRLGLRFSCCALPRYQEPLCSQQRYQHLRSPRALRSGLPCGSARIGVYDLTGYFGICQIGTEVYNPKWTPVSCVRTSVIDSFISILGYLAVMGCMPWETRNGVGFTTFVASGWLRDRGFQRLFHERGQEVVGSRRGVDCNLCFPGFRRVCCTWDLRDFINLAQLDAGHLWYITFVSPETCHNDATFLRTCSFALLGMRA